MSTSTIILLVLGLIVLAVLSIGFMSGWNAFQSQTGKTNVDEVVEECRTTCSLGQQFSFCSAEKELRFAEEDIVITASCAVFANEPNLQRKYGVQSCPRIDCAKPCEEIRVNEMYGQIVNEDYEDFYDFDVSALASDLVEGEKCII